MKKELVALLLLILILAGNIWNQRRLDRLTAGLDRLTEKAFASARDGRWQEAEEAAGQAAQEWTEAGNYTHIFIRHTDIDALTAAFCDYRGAIAGRETGEIYAVYLRLNTGIRSLQSMEKLSAGSIF